MRLFRLILVGVYAGLASLAAGASAGAPDGAPDGVQDGAQDCRGQFAGGLIPVKTEAWDVDVCKTADGQPTFAIRFDPRRQTPDFVAYALTPENLAKLTKRKRPRFRPDAALPAHSQAQDQSYTRSGYSRGHMVPAHDMSWSAPAYRATFDLSNAVPQLQSFNAGSWLGLEDAVRKLVRRTGTALWTITGVYGTNPDRPTIGSGGHTPTVPACFFKILAAPNANGTHNVMAVVLRFDDTAPRSGWTTGLTTLDVVRERTGIAFLDGLTVNAPFDAAYWGVEPPQTPADCI